MENSTELMVQAKSLSHRWPNQSEDTLSIDALRLKRGDRMLITGPSGSGKTTLLSLISGLIPLKNGEIIIDGVALSSLSQKQVDTLRAQKMGVIFQQFNLLPYLSVIDNVLLPITLGSGPTADARQKAISLLESLRIPNATMELKAANLSVGQQQRVAIARAFIGKPKLIIADEPTSALDDEARTLFFELLDQKCNEYAATLLMVSHDSRFETNFQNILRLS